MFDISFSELMVIAVVTLLVVGPDKLPQLARTIGAFVGRLQRYVAQVKEEVNREVRFEELQNLQQEIKDSKRNLEASIMDGADNMHKTVSSLKTTINSKSDPVEAITKVNANSSEAANNGMANKKRPKKNIVKNTVGTGAIPKKKANR